jgi:hypothetical protein
MKKNEIGWARGTHGEQRAASSILVGRTEEGNHLENLVVNGWIILKCIFKK